MGFINIGTQSAVHTRIHGKQWHSAIGTSICSNTGVITTSGTTGQHLVYGGSTANYSIHTTYHVLGEDIEVDAYNDANLAIAISTLNVLGKPFYDELKKNNVSLPKEIEEYLEIKFKILERDRKIKDILKP